MKTLVTNKKVSKDFGIFDRYTGGIELLGGEVKSLRLQNGSLKGAFLTLRKNYKDVTELFIKNLFIPPYQPKNMSEGYDPERLRKILIKRRELNKIERELQAKGTTIVPIRVGLDHNRVKIEFALARGKKKFDKREDLKQAAQKRDIERDLKVRMK